MQYPEQWRETCDPFALNYHTFRPLEILGCPHAGNDVFYARGEYMGREVRAFIKAARQKGADIANEAAVLGRLRGPCFPRVIDCGLGERPFSVTLELPGRRLSAILGENEGSLAYMEEYGGALARLHSLSIPAEPVADRRFFHTPSERLLQGLGLSHLRDRFAQKPAGAVTCFCHGDFHYANILWEGRRISGILDFELAGYGNRDFDIAWALILRPGQAFLKTREELDAFLRGYERRGACDREAVGYYMAQSYVYFLSFSGEDEAYCRYVRAWLADWGEGR